MQFFLQLATLFNSSLGRCKIGKYTFPSHFANIFLTYQTFVTNLHLLRVELRCKLPGKMQRVTGPLAHHVVLNHTFEFLKNITMLFHIFEMSISINKWNYKQMYVQVNISTNETYIHACCNKLCVTASSRLNHIHRNSRAYRIYN